jgi:hypothetical protein
VWNSGVLAIPNLATAAAFVKGRSHFVMWKVHGSECAWNATYPKDSIPFPLSVVTGRVGHAGVFQANCHGIEYRDGVSVRSVKSVVIVPDIEAQIQPEPAVDDDETPIPGVSVARNESVRRISRS